MVRGSIFLLFTVISFAVFAQTPAAKTDSNAVKQLFFAGLKDKLSDNFTSAVSNFSKVVNVDKNNHAAYFELANASLKLNKIAEAEQYIQVAIKINPNNPWYYRLLAEIYKLNNKMPELITVFNQLIRIDPEYDNYYFDKANAQYLAGQVEESKKTYQLIAQKFGNSKDLTLALQRFQSIDKKSDSDIVQLLEGNQADAKNYLYAAELLRKKNNLAEAQKVLQKAKTLMPENYEIDMALAGLYHQQKNEEAAFAALKLAFDNQQMPFDAKIKILAGMFNNLKDSTTAKNINAMSRRLAEKNPDNPKALALYGDVLYQLRQLPQALMQYQAALKLNDQIYAVWEQIINIQTLMGKYPEALKVADDALTLYPNQASLYYYTAYALYKTKQNETALKQLSTAQQLNADNKNFIAQVYALQGDIYISQNNVNQAKAAFDNALTADPNNPLIMNSYAYYLALRDDDLQKAEKLAQTASSALPFDASTADTYAFVLFKQKKYDQAKIWIEKAIQNNNTNNGVYLEHYGDILYLLGNQAQALAQWQKAKLAGNDSDILTKKINEKKYFK